jgi:hypothetical protein
LVFYEKRERDERRETRDERDEREERDERDERRAEGHFLFIIFLNSGRKLVCVVVVVVVSIYRKEEMCYVFGKMMRRE